MQWSFSFRGPMAPRTREEFRIDPNDGSKKKFDVRDAPLAEVAADFRARELVAKNADKAVLKEYDSALATASAVIADARGAEVEVQAFGAADLEDGYPRHFMLDVKVLATAETN